MKYILALFLISSYSFSECVDERLLTGAQIEASSESFYIETEDAIFVNSNQLNLEKQKTYKVHVQEHMQFKNTKSYNSKYIEYYTYKRMQTYLKSIESKLINLGLELRVVGKSLEGRDLYAITPKNLVKKKTILMFGRHHGDEGTANWIIEGFLNRYLEDVNFNSNYQLVLYPMVNPDGAEARTRYNSKGRDLNRSWHKSLLKSYDEVRHIHRDLKKIMKKVQKNIFIALDMHGSFTEDFFFRVKKNYVSIDFYNHQQSFIDELAKFDTWQNGNFKATNGDKGMARIVLINHYKKHALTHETIRNIPLKNSQNRSKQSLFDQGVALIHSIQNLY